MVIISWNMAKTKNLPFDQVLKLCERWEASVLVAQEPTRSLIHFGSQREPNQPRGCNHSWTGEIEGSGQGSIVIIRRNGVEIGNVTPVDLGVGQGTRRITKTNPLVCFEAREGAETMTFATCHSPYDLMARAKYSSNAIVAGRDRDTDCIIGDMNSYGNRVPVGSSSRPSGYQCPPLGATSARGEGSPLDKVFLADKHTNYLAGRVIPGGDSKRVKNTQERSDKVKDIVDKDWKQCVSDHLPIYIAFNEGKARIEKTFFDDDDAPQPARKKRAVGNDTPVAQPVED